MCPPLSTCDLVLWSFGFFIFWSPLTKTCRTTNDTSKLIQTSIPWATRLSWLENAYSGCWWAQNEGWKTNEDGDARNGWRWSIWWKTSKKMVRRHSRLVRLYTNRGCSTGIGQNGMEKNHWLEWPQWPTWTVSSKVRRRLDCLCCWYLHCLWRWP